MTAANGSGAPPPETADLAASTEAYATRFAGATGAWLLSVQTDAIMNCLRRAGVKPPARVLDVGGGHAQVTPPLVAAGYAVTAMVSSDPAAALLLARLGDAAQVSVCDLMALPVADGAAEAVLSLRMMAHVRDWRGYLSELARTARRAVIIDLPLARRKGAGSGPLFWLKKRLEGNTRPYRSYRLDAVEAALAEEGFRIESVTRQFVVPMVVHRKLKSPRLSRALEAVARRIFPRRGNPAILLACRQPD